jgi:hypothetical protein
VIPARYSLIRYVPDTARGEQLNIGILAWTERHLAVELDQNALGAWVSIEGRRT